MITPLPVIYASPYTTCSYHLELNNLWRWYNTSQHFVISLMCMHAPRSTDNTIDKMTSWVKESAHDHISLSAVDQTKGQETTYEWLFVVTPCHMIWRRRSAFAREVLHRKPVAISVKACIHLHKCTRVQDGISTGSCNLWITQLVRDMYRMPCVISWTDNKVFDLFLLQK
jgi:hypothetical protein